MKVRQKMKINKPMQWVTKGDRKRENTRHLIPKKKTQHTGAVDTSTPRKCSGPKKGIVVGKNANMGQKSWETQ